MSRIPPKLLPLLLAFLPAWPSPVGAEIALQGVACTVPLAHFALIDSVSGDNRWISLGDVFSCFTARAYDPESETLLLGKDGRTVRLSLSYSSPQPTPPAVEFAVPTESNNVERAYSLATARDEQAGGFMRRLRGEIKTRLDLTREFDAAETAFAQNPSRENAQRLSDAKRTLDAEARAEIFLWTRAVEPAASR